MKLSKKLQQKLDNRSANNALRELALPNSLVDFSSNDYLGFAKSKTIFEASHQYLVNNDIIQNGSTGSRLLSGNHSLYTNLENKLCEVHHCEAALVFNSGYDANLGFFSSLPQRHDIILYDEFSHASIRDGIQLSNAKAYKFEHNNLEDLERIILRHSELVSESHQNIYIVTESVFSMDGDTPDLDQLTKLSNTYNAHLVVDEAHAIGVFGEYGCGKIQELNLENAIFARIITFGKALGAHGAAILGSSQLKSFLINFSRSFVYTTALPPHALATIYSAYYVMLDPDLENRKQLLGHIQFFKSEIERLQLKNSFIASDSAIHCCIISGNDHVKHIASLFQKNGFNVKPILSPTVAKGHERLRFCLHSYNSKEEITKVLKLLATFVVM